ncbi:early endosome antigen 1-like [Silurus meridionalis]|uniref:early endosome antigen 1-like n=1 Tax=Silurus meridionalis TaxID=175797 RepID=UPI001EEBA574|nr:early endosome antigen 1-like [Silurus meridionalis]
MMMAWFQLLLFTFLSFAPLTTLSRAVLGEEADDGDDENILKGICEGIDEQLNICNKKLSEKTDYSFDLENDLFALKEQQRVIKLSCINASQASSLQVAALQKQLDSMLLQLGEKTSGPAEAVLNLLQEYVKAQKLELELLVETDPKKIAEKQKQLQKLKSDMTEQSENLKDLECETTNNDKLELKVSELEGRNKYLEEQFSNTQEECNDLQENYEEILSGLEDTNSNLKNIVDVLSLKQKISELEDKIRSETSESKRTELENELKEKKKELDLKKRDNKDPDMDKILTIISKLEEMKKLQVEMLGADSSHKIKEMKDEVLRLISELDDSNVAKIVLKNLVLLTDESHLKKLISDIKQKTDKQIADLQEEVRKKEEELKKKVTESGEVTKLNRDISALREEVKNLMKQVKDLENTSAAQIRELEKQLNKKKQELENMNNTLKDKNAELAEKVLKITELIENLKQTKEEANRRNQEAAEKITDLETKLQKEEAEAKRLQEALKRATECIDLKNSYNQLKADFDKTVLKLNDTLINQVFTIQSLNQDIKNLEDKISSSGGNVDELNKKLQEKKEELEEAKQKIKKAKGESLKFLKLLEDLRKTNRKQEDHIKEYLTKIKKLNKKLQEKKEENAGAV